MNRSWFAGFCVIAALTLVGRLVRGPREEPVPPPRPAVAAAPTRSSVEGRWAPAEDRGPSDRALADALVGYWRGETIQGVTTSFRFDGTGVFACSVEQTVNGRAPIIHGGAAGEWRIERGQLQVRWINADNPSFRAWIGRTAQSQIRFEGDEWIRLAGVEGDDVVRTYRRAY